MCFSKDNYEHKQVANNSLNGKKGYVKNIYQEDDDEEQSDYDYENLFVGALQVLSASQSAGNCSEAKQRHCEVVAVHGNGVKLQQKNSEAT